MASVPSRRWVRALGLLAAGTLVLSAVGCSDGGDDDTASTTTGGSTDTSTPAQPGLRLGVVSTFEYDPARVVPTEYGHMMGLDLLYDGLVASDPVTGEPAPALAEEWEATDGFTRWTFTLRDDATFSDGAPITADDVKFSLERLAARGTDSLAGVRLEVIKGYEEYVAEEEEGIGGIEVIDDRTLEITTTEAFAPLPELLASPVFGVVPAELVGDDGNGFFAAPVGSGPLMLAGEDATTAAAAERPDGADDLALFVPAPGSDVNVGSIQLVHFDDVASSYAAFVDGGLDWSLVPGDLVDEAREDYSDQAFSPYHAEFFFGINVGNPTYADADFREAIVRAVDRQAIVDDLIPNGTALNGTVVEGVPGFAEDPCGEVCAHDPEAAADLLGDAFDDPEDIPTVNLDFYEGERERGLAEAIAEDLEAVDIPVELRPHEVGEYKTFVTSSDQEVFLFGWVGIAPTADSYLAPLFLSGSPDNVTAFGSEAVDAGLAAARAFETAEERAEAYAAVEETILAEAPVIPLVQMQTLAVVSDRVTGWLPQLDGTFVVGEVGIEE